MDAQGLQTNNSWITSNTAFPMGFYGPMASITNPFPSTAFSQNLMPMSLPFSFNPIQYNAYFDKDFMMTMAMFDGFRSTPNFFPCPDEVFNNTYRTQSDLPTLKGVYNSEMANQLANIAEKNASRRNTTGMCFRGVRESLEAAGLSKGEVRGESAYMAADMLANHKNFQEIQGVSKDQLRDLPAGCIIVWDKSFWHKHGHIGVTLGDGREASDKVRDKVVLLNSEYRVFVPKGIDKSG